MPPQEHGQLPTNESIMPTWFKLVFRTFAVFLLIDVLVITVRLALHDRASSSLSSGNLLDIGFYVLAALFFVLAITYGIALLRLKRWTLPIFLFFLLSSLVTDALGLAYGKYDSTAALIVYGITTVVLLGAAYGTWKYRTAFVGPTRKLWLQIPLFLVLIAVTLVSALGQIYTDDEAVYDADLQLANVPVLAEADNAHFALPRVDALSQMERSALERARDLYSALENDEDIDMTEATDVTSTLSAITDRFIEASRKPGYQCPSTVNAHILDAEICPLNDLRDIAQAVALRSYVEATEGDFEAALISAQAPAELSTRIDASHPLIIEHLVAIAVMNIGVASVERVVDQAAADLPSTLTDQLETYRFDGSALETSLKREYLSAKAIADSYEWPGEYLWHPNSTVNDLAELTRVNIETARAQCGSDVTQKVNTANAAFDAARSDPLWWTLIKPNSVGGILKHVAVANLSAVRGKECWTNEAIDALQQRIPS